MNRNPATTPRCSDACSSVRLPANDRRTDHTRSIDTRNVAAFRPNTVLGPTAVTSTPPTAGPSMTPEFSPMLTQLFAHGSCAGSSIRFGIAARDAEKNGDSATADRKANPTNQTGSWVRAIAAKHSAAPSEISITRGRRVVLSAEESHQVRDSTAVTAAG